MAGKPYHDPSERNLDPCLLSNEEMLLGKTETVTDRSECGIKKVVDCMNSAQVVLKFSKKEIEEIIKVREEQFLKNEIRIVLIGKTGVGKSATANTILGENAFKVDDGMSSVTQVCGVRQKTINRREVLVVDTPGIFDTERELKDLENEIRECIKLTSPGPHAILFVMKLNEKFKNEDYEAFITFVQFFGLEIFEHVIVVFTHADVLHRKDQTLDEYLHECAPPKLHKLLQHLGNRKIAFNNEGTELLNHQVDNLFTIIETIREGKKNTSYYRNDVYDKAERDIVEAEKPMRATIEGRFYTVVNDFVEKRKEEEVRKIQLRMESEMYRLRQQTRRSVPHMSIFRKGMIIRSHRDEIEEKLEKSPKQ